MLKEGEILWPSCECIGYANITGTYDGLHTTSKGEVDFEKIETNAVSNLDDFANNSYIKETPSSTCSI